MSSYHALPSLLRPILIDLIDTITLNTLKRSHTDEALKASKQVRHLRSTYLQTQRNQLPGNLCDYSVFRTKKSLAHPKN